MTILETDCFETGKRIELKNGCLTVSFSLSAEPGPLVPEGKMRWYAGSANSIRYRYDAEPDVEMLDFNRHYLSHFEWRGHDPEKRCMQIDQIMLHDPSLGTDITARVGVFDRDYEVISVDRQDRECSILVQCRLTCPAFASLPMDQALPRYFLRRKITLRAETNYVLDDVSVVRCDDAGRSPVSQTAIDFDASYFAFIDCGLAPTVSRDLAQGWFTAALTGGHAYAKQFAYGFLSSATPITSLDNPAPGFPYPNMAHKTFSWQTARCRHFCAVHFFSMGSEIDIQGTALRQVRP
jgi:hypothetical protein